MRPQEVPAELLRAPFRYRDARELGVSRAVLRGDRFRAPYRGVRVASSLEETVELQSAAALTALPPGSVLCCHSAARLRGLPVPADAAVHAAVPASVARPRVAGIRVHRRDVPSVEVRGLAVSRPEATFLELAEHVPLVDLVVLGDALVRHGWVRLEELHLAVAGSGSRRGLPRARAAVALVRPRVDSPMETRSRLLFGLAGLPTPTPGYRVIVEGQVIGWVDLALPAYKIAIEYDGDLHRTLKKKWRLDVATREALRDEGWAVLVLTWDDCAVTPVRTVGRLARELARRGCPEVPLGWRDGSIDPSTLPPAWREAFPGRSRRAWDWDDGSTETQ